MKSETEKALKAIEQEADQRRREAQAEINRPVPKVIQAIEYTWVTFTFDPNVLPYMEVDPKKFSDLLMKSYALKYVSPGFNTDVIRAFNINPTEITDDMNLAIALREPRPNIQFEHGRFPTGKDTFVSIVEARFRYEDIAVKVRGKTAVAEAVAADLMDLLWQAAGAQKRFNDEDVQAALFLKSYSTSTKAELGGDLRRILCPELVSFLDDNLSENKAYGPQMVAHSIHDKYMPSSNTFTSWTFDTLRLQVHCFDKVTYLPQVAEIMIEVTSKVERGRGMATVTTHLPFDAHVELVKDLSVVLQGT